jgi:hypothetical protein
MSQPLNTRETRDSARELKFFLAPETAAAVRRWATDRLAPDPHASGPGGEYRTTSLYFDTAEFDVFRRRGSNGRSKYRIRRYGVSDVVFLERKLRTSSMLIKRRTTVAITSLDRLALRDVDPMWPGAWFHRRLLARRLQTTAQVSYRRTAHVGAATWGPMRLAFLAGPAVPVVPDKVILELKFRVDMPALFRHLVETFALQPVAISKYRLSVPTLGLVDDPADGGRTTSAGAVPARVQE